MDNTLKTINLWVDDERLPPEGWVWAKTYQQAIDYIDNNEIKYISLDHDLGDYDDNMKEWTGYDVLMYIVQRKMDELAIPEKIQVHTANPVASERMKGVIVRYLSNDSLNDK